MEVSSKTVKLVDTKTRFELPTKTLKHISFPHNRNSVELLVTDRSGKPWSFTCRKRREGHPKHSLTRGWLMFVRLKGVRVGDRVIFGKLQGGEFRIEVKRETSIKLFGNNMWVNVEDADGYGID